MDNYALYHDIATRTGGDLYIGLVGPVRTGKSTFIKKFMDLLVLPYMEDAHEKERTIDAMPLSAPGSTVTTTEPKFIPKEAAKVALNPETTVKMRLIDCVGFMVKGADSGERQGNQERMVRTPWFDYEIPFSKAAEIGTQKVISDHATIGLVMTTDGSFGEIQREHFVMPEQKTIEELKHTGKPFVVLLNSQQPAAEGTQKLAQKMAETYGVRVLPVNCKELVMEDIQRILEAILMEFPIAKFEVYFSKWVEMLKLAHPVKESVFELLRTLMTKYEKVSDLYRQEPTHSSPYISKFRVDQVDLSTGCVKVELDFFEKFYYETMSELCGVPIEGEYQMIELIRELSHMKKEYEKVLEAVGDVRRSGYGVVTPSKTEIKVEQPTIIKQGNKFGVKIKATSPSIHMIRAEIETEIAPIVGDEQQAKDLITFINQNQQNEGGIWDTNIFGKSIEQLVDDGIKNKLSQMGEECQGKLQDTMKKIVNDSNGGMVCIIL